MLRYFEKFYPGYFKVRQDGKSSFIPTLSHFHRYQGHIMITLRQLKYILDICCLSFISVVIFGPEKLGYKGKTGYNPNI